MSKRPARRPGSPYAKPAATAREPGFPKGNILEQMKIQMQDREESQTLPAIRQRLRSHVKDWVLLAIQLKSANPVRCQHAASGLFLSFRSLNPLTRQFLDSGARRSPGTCRSSEILASLEEIRHLFRRLRKGKSDSSSPLFRQLRVAAETLVLLLSAELLRNERVVPFVPVTGAGRQEFGKLPEPDRAGSPNPSVS
jgi:hypothetical protein